jgi:SAM-dependent methyltransferase
MSDDRFGEILKLSIRSRLFHVADFFYNLVHYWRHIGFLKIDFSILLQYFSKSPYRIVRDLTLEAYGETPFSVMDSIAKALELKPSDHLYELGCGRGRACFFLSYFYRCKVTGVEIIPIFVKKAEEIKMKFCQDNVTFHCSDLFSEDLSDASCIYIYGTTLDDESIKTLTKKIESLRPGVKVVTISYPLESSKIQVKKEIPVSFPWGKTTGYIGEIIASA